MNRFVIGFCNYLSPAQWQTITLTNANQLSIGLLPTAMYRQIIKLYFVDILNRI